MESQRKLLDQNIPSKLASGMHHSGASSSYVNETKQFEYFLYLALFFSSLIRTRLLLLAGFDFIHEKTKRDPEMLSTHWIMAVTSPRPGGHHTKKNVLSCRSFIADILNSNFLYSHLLCPSEREVSLADIIDRGKHKFLFLIKFDKSFLFVSSDVSEMRLFMSFTLFVDMSRSIIVDES